MPASRTHVSGHREGVLLGSFLGVGIGVLGVGRSDWFRRAPVLLGVLVFVSAVFPVTIDRTGNSLILFGVQARGLPIWISLPIVFAVPGPALNRGQRVAVRV